MARMIYYWMLIINQEKILPFDVIFNKIEQLEIRINEYLRDLTILQFREFYSRKSLLKTKTFKIIKSNPLVFFALKLPN